MMTGRDKLNIAFFAAALTVLIPLTICDVISRRKTQQVALITACRTLDKAIAINRRLGGTATASDEAERICSRVKKEQD